MYINQLLIIIIISLKSIKCEQQRIFNVSEGASIGYIIGYINGTSSDGIQANFYIVYSDNSGETEKYLAVEEVSGEIRVLRELDYERRTSYHLIAVPINRPQQEEAIHVIVNVIDENDNTPTFPVSSIDVSISEFAALNSEISLPPAVDNDSPPLSVIRYHILSGNVNNAFKLSSKRINSKLYVDLIVNGQLDREYRSQYELLIEALDGGNPPNSGTMLVNVTILDANDNAPEFNQTEYGAFVPLNVSMNDIVAAVHAIDFDLGENARIAYSIAKSHSDLKLPFEIDGESGIVRVTDPALLISGSIYQLLIVANDHGLPQPLESTTFLTITIEKSNQSKINFDIIWLTDNNQPEIYENITVGYVIARITVQNAPQKSELFVNGCDALCIKETDSLDVYLVIACGSFDREQKSKYNLLFTMKSHGKQLLEIPVFLEILDVNDNAPKFDKSPIHVIFNQSTTQFKLIRIHATDLDSGKNGRINYSLSGTNQFKIESDTGILSIHENFDCLLNREYHFRVCAKDFGTPSLSTTVDVIAEIIDSNGQPPLFTKPLYDVTIGEDIESGTCLLKVTANNSCGNESNVQYSLSKTDPVNEPFRIDAQSGTICLESILDYEQCTIYQLHVYAHNINGRFSRALVNIHVKDVNDNLPIFYTQQYNVSIRENIAMNSLLVLISANDADSEIYGKVTYRFETGQSDTDAFRLDEKSGRLYVKNKLSKRDYHLKVEAIDGSGLVSEKKATVHISVISKSILTPQFTNALYEFNVLEGTLPGIIIGEVKAKGFFPINYNAYSGDPDHFFSINAKNGQISIAQYLDADKWEQLLLNVQAIMENGEMNYTQVLIKLTDSNDNAPIFELNKIESYVYENYPTNVPFFAIQAYDKDRGKNGDVKYALLESEPEECPILIQPLSGELILTAKLDFELINKYWLIIEAQDDGIPPRSSNITVIVNILDINDNKPEFKEQMYFVDVPEDAQLMTDILTVQAKDLDSEQNARISYQFSEENDNFGINSVTGNIFVKGILDREMIPEYHLFVIASDNGKPQLSSQTNIHIKILDVNDNSPLCPVINSFTLSDKIDIGVTFDKIVATDPDEGLNGSLLYRLKVEDINFAIQENGELFMKRKITMKDHRKESRLSVIIFDRNGDMQARSTICPIRIIIGKLNSKVKLLEPIDRIIRIDEKCISNCLLKILNATDVARWEIKLSDISNNFEIWNNTIRTSAYFNKTTINDSQTLSVIAFDNDNHQQQIVFIIRISKLGLSHRDDKTTVIRIPNTISVGSKLVTLSNETNNNATIWHLKNETDAFYLDSITSTLYLATNIRWFHQKSYLLNVEKWHSLNYKQIEQQNIYIEIEPTNIHWPQFLNCPRFLTIKENEPTGSIIGKVSAEDTNDDDDDGQLSYSIVQSSTGLFSIDPDTAELLLIRSLHWEKDLSLFLVVEAENSNSDVIRRSHCVVFINVEDINDHQPQFLSSQKITIDDNFVNDDIIHHIVAIDDDAGGNGKVTYALIDGNTDNAFSIDSNTGALILKHRFNNERRIRIRASDNGVPSRYAEKDITVKFDSGHQQWKFFPQRKYFINMNGSATPGTVLHDFFANRNGWPQMKLFPYFVSENDILQLSDDGKLIILKAVTPGIYDWLVIALGEEKLIDWTFVHLSVIGTNQYPPRITSSNCGNLTIRENVAAKHLTRIYAWDEDASSDNKIFYKIVAGNENSAFFLNSTTGLLSCRELDREQQSQYFLVITVEDQGIPNRADTCALRITVTDENDNVPVFNDNNPTLIEIDDNKRVGDILGRLSATDDDEGSSGKILFSIIEDASGLLDIRANTGEIIFARDYPTSQNEYTIKVKAEDQGISRVLSSELNIKLHLIRSKSVIKLDEPQFLSEHYFGFINEGEQRGQFVLQIRSSDRLTEDAPLSYSIISGNMDRAFDIDDNGRIITTQQLDYEIQNIYALKVIGTSNVMKISETNIHIRVINTNDNVPSFPILKDVKVLESATYGTLIGTVVATDVDIDTQLEYSLLSSNDLFEIDPFTGKIFLIQNLDYESDKEHIVHIQVTDGDNTSSATLRIIVVDVNDNAPQFEQQFYLINIVKNIELDSVIAKIHASDPDTGLAGTIRYELVLDNQKYFRINPESGDLLINGKLEDQSTYYLMIHAFDQGKPVQSSAVAVQINVGIDDYNRKPIQFTNESFNFTIPENIHPYIEFGKVTLIDELPVCTSLRIQNFEFSNIFGISRDGSIFLKYPVDAEFKSDYEFLVEASSPYATYNSSVKVYVKVMDLNDNAPYFIEKMDEITISEGMIINEVLGRFVAVDNDSDDNGRISYQVLSGNNYGIFNLNSSSGVLYLEKNIDIEEMNFNDALDNLLIAAIDNGIPSRLNWTSVRINFNSNFSSATAPFFIVSQYERSIFENLPKGSIVLHSKAVNKLGLPGDNWIYTITDTNESFVCNKSTGHIILSKKLDFEMQTKYEFILKVHDNQNRSAMVSVRIRVLGIDEYPPLFTKTNYIFQISRNLQIGEYIGVVSAIDHDSGIDGIIRYEIQGSASQYLSIDSNTGQIILSHQFPHRANTNITNDEFIVTASSSAKQTSRTKVILQIGEFLPRDVFSTRKTLTMTQSLTIGSLLLLFVLLITLIALVINMRIKNRTKSKKMVHNNKGNFTVIRNTNESSPRFQNETQIAPLPSSSYTKFKNSSITSTHLNNNTTKILYKPPIETQMGNYSITYSMPDSGIDPDEISVTSSVTDYLNQVGVTPNKYFESNQGTSREFFMDYKNDANNDPEISELIYAKVDEILSPANRMNAYFTSNNSINISSFNANLISTDSVPSFRPLSELLLDMKKQQR
ncbi:Cadherin domain containing protein [Brugia malayi]|uniref:Cadherin domain containing protein n=5 Tax=Brugia TaxID=6278 RepID=A0A4E9F4G0_BRUMA|nr:Cadherin domain containing protein [Brugia malayi]VIO90129.1 Cadherin domain containing protein [Brugia malayi]